MTRRCGAAVALLLFVAASAAAQGDLTGQLRRAEVFERAGQLTSALAVLSEILEATPAQPAAILAAERIHRRLDRLADLLPLLEHALEVEPASALVRQVELRVLSDLGRDLELREAGERWLRFPNTGALAYREYASVLRRQGDLLEAEDVLRRGRRRLGGASTLAPELAELFLEGRRWSEAAAEWLAILADSPGLGWELINFKLESLGMGASAPAEALLEAIPEDASGEAERRVAAIAALYADRFDEARDKAASVLSELGPASRQEFVSRFARIAAQRSNPALVAWAYRHLLLDSTDETERWDLARQIVRHDLSAGDTTAALDLLGELLARAEPAGSAHRWASGTRVRLYAVGGEAARAERELTRHVEHYGSDLELPVLALAVGEAYIRGGQFDEASRVLALVPASPGNPSVAARMAAVRGYLALYAGQYDAARSELELAAATLTGDERSGVLRILGFLRQGHEAELAAAAAAHREVLQGRGERGLTRLLDGLRGAPVSSARPGLLLWAGELAVEAGDLERGESILRGIPERYPRAGEAPVALMTLAEALAAADGRAAAIELLERLIIDYPDSALTPLGRRRLAELRGQVPRS